MEPNVNAEAGLMLRALRQGGGLTIKKTAALLSRSAATLSRMETGKSRVDLTVANEYIRLFLGVPNAIPLVSRGVARNAMAFEKPEDDGQEQAEITALVTSFIKRYTGLQDE